MFKPKGRAHRNVFIHLHKHHLSRRRQLLKQRKFSGSRVRQPISGGPAVALPTRSVFQVSESAASTVGGARERRLSFHVIRRRDE